MSGAEAHVNGSFMKLSEAKIPVLDRGFLFAAGVYEVTAVIDGHLVDLAAHMARLERSARELSLDLPEPIDRIIALHHELITRAGLSEGAIYLQVTRGAAADRDFVFPTGVKPSLVMFTQVKSLIDNPAARTGIAVKTVPDIRWGRRDIKSVMLLVQVMAKHEAALAGAQDAWLVEPDGTITEGASTTAFIVESGTIRTRPNSRMILPGCTRRAIEMLAVEHNLRIEDRAFTRAEALAADEAFCTSATSFVLPVVRIDEQAIGGGVPGPLTNRLRQLYIDVAKQLAN